MQRITRGLTDIRTLSGRVDQAAIPHRAYLKISCLEMEKARLGKERDAALQRVAAINQRFGEIDAEKKALLAAMEERGAEPAARPSNPRSTGGFKVRY